LGSVPPEVVPVWLDPELRAALTELAGTWQTSTGDFIREASREWLHVA
jgi:hypothetical protein